MSNKPTKNKVPQGRRWTVDTHPERDKIIAKIVKGESSLRNIAEHFGISISCISRYLQGKLAAQAGAVMADTAEKNGSSLLQRVEKVMKRMEKLYDACDEYLRDPKDPEKYELGPKAWEIDVSFTIPDPKDRKKTISGHDTLNNLLAKLEANKIHTKSIHYRHSDPRKLIIETAGVLSKQLELIGRIQGNFEGEATIMNVLMINQKAENHGD